MCLCVFLLGFILPGTLCASWILLTISFPMLGKFSTVISSDIFSGPLSFSSCGTPIMWMLVCLMLSQRSLRLACHHFFFFSIFFFAARFPPFYPQHHLSVLRQLFCYWILLVYYSSLCLFLSSSRSLVNISCIFSILFQDPGSSSLSLSWILFL